MDNLSNFRLDQKILCQQKKKGPPKNLNIKNLNTFVNLNFYQIKIKEMNEKDKMHLKTILQCTIVVKTQIVPMT